MRVVEASPPELRPRANTACGSESLIEVLLRVGPPSLQTRDHAAQARDEQDQPVGDQHAPLRGVREGPVDFLQWDVEASELSDLSQRCEPLHRSEPNRPGSSGMFGVSGQRRVEAGGVTRMCSHELTTKPGAR